jgi:putative aldouronate transport system permease protein
MMVLKNTISVSLYSLAFGFLPPILLALMLNQVNNLRYKRFIQTVSYAPHFITTVVMVSLLFCLLSTNNGIVNNCWSAWNRPILLYAGRQVFPQRIRSFRHLAGDGLFRHHLHQRRYPPSARSARSGLIDGANKLQRIWHIDIPAFCLP